MDEAKAHLAAEPPVRTRRWLLAGGVAAVAGAGVGVLAGELPDRSAPRRAPHPPPAALVAAAHAEQALIADLDATTGGSPTVRRAIVAARADHAAHLRVLRGLLARYDAPSPAASPTPRRAASRSRAQLRDAERTAAAGSARRAAATGGATGALFASISACESTHAELFA